MCLAASYWANISHIVYANDRHLADKIGFSDKFIYDQFELSNDNKSISMKRIPTKKAENIMKSWTGKHY